MVLAGTARALSADARDAIRDRDRPGFLEDEGSLNDVALLQGLSQIGKHHMQPTGTELHALAGRDDEAAFNVPMRATPSAVVVSWTVKAPATDAVPAMRRSESVPLLVMRM